MSALAVAIALLSVSLSPASSAPVAPPDAEVSWPERRFAPCGAFDAQRSRLYVFGGRTEGGLSHHDDAWGLRMSPGALPEWRELARPGAGNAPPPIRSCAAAFDPVTRRLIVFAGWNGVVMQNGVWSLSLGHSSGVDPTWTQLCDASSCGTAPTPRRSSQAVYDASRRQLVVMGGLDGAFRNDVWTLNLTGTPRWTQVSPAGDAPPERAGHSMVADERRDRVWLFGGTRSGSDLADTWWFDLGTTTWHRADTTCPTTCPTARSGAAMAHDLANDRLVLYGGWESTTNVYPREAWTLTDLDGTPTWAQLAVESASPQPRFFHAAGYDPSLERLVVFGGGSGASTYKDTAALHLPRGGRTAFWRGVQPATPITARDQVAVTFDRTSRRLTAFGGFGTGTFPGARDAGAHLADTFQQRLGATSTGGWRNVTPRSATAIPLAREATAYAPDRAGRLYVVGGLTGDTELNDVWVAERTNDPRPRWRQLCSPTSCGTPPAPRWGAHAIYDPRGPRLIVFGGRGANNQTFNDTWALELADSPQWRQLPTTGAPPTPRWGGAAMFDAADGRLIVTGGQNGNDAGGVTNAETWALSLDDTPTWTALQSTAPIPAPRRSAGYATRPGRGGTTELLVTGGLTSETATHHNDVWSLAVSGNQATWTQLAADDCTGESTVPACRRSASTVHDPNTNSLVTVFGRDGASFFNDTWRFDLTSRRWSVVSAPAAVRRATAKRRD